MSRHGAPHRLEGNIDSFLSEPRFHLQEIFSEERFPNVVVALDGTVIATWGSRNLVARRSEDGGASWGERISVGDGIHAGGSTVDCGVTRSSANACGGANIGKVPNHGKRRCSHGVHQRRH